jgi:hypothetical protein
MRFFPVILLAIGLFVLPAETRSDDPADTITRQKQTAETNWSALKITPPAKAESANLLLFGTIPESRIKALAATLEKQCAVAVKALQFEKDEKPWVGKLAVYVFADRAQFRSFVRQVQKRSPDDAEHGTQDIKNEAPHVATAAGKGRDAPTAEVVAGQQLAAALLASRAKDVPLPEWLVVGFGRATAAQAAGVPPAVRKRTARELARRLRASDAWNEALPAEQRFALAAGVADYLFYGKGADKPADFLLAFRPSDEQPMKSVADALSAIKLTPELLEAGYARWLRSNN